MLLGTLAHERSERAEPGARLPGEAGTASTMGCDGVKGLLPERAESDDES